MNDLLSYTLTVFTGFFAIMNPIANTPIFLGLVDNVKPEHRAKIARTACLVAFIIVVSFIFLGKYIFELFDITIPAFKITGGILVFYVGFEMLMSKKSKVQNTDTADDDKGIAISPLAIPILAGPGTIVTAMNFVTKAEYIHIGIVIATFAFIILLTYIAFVLSERIMKIIGQNMIDVIGKIMGLIIAIIGTGMILEGIKLSFNL
ncbi:MAG: MarC family protein [Bacteroidaceae bacterium]